MAANTRSKALLAQGREAVGKRHRFFHVPDTVVWTVQFAAVSVILHWVINQDMSAGCSNVILTETFSSLYV